MTKLGIKTNILAVLMCTICLASGWLGALLVAGYILLQENDAFLRKTAIKALCVMALVALIDAAIDLLPAAISWLSVFMGFFGGSLYIGVLNTLCSWVTSLASLAQEVVLLIMAWQAFHNKEFAIKPLDNLVDNIMGVVVAAPVVANNTVVAEPVVANAAVEAGDKAE